MNPGHFRKGTRQNRQVDTKSWLSFYAEMAGPFTLRSTADDWPRFEAGREGRAVRLRDGAEAARGLVRDHEGWARVQYPNGELLDLPRALYVAFRHSPPFDELPLTS